MSASTTTAWTTTITQIEPNHVRVRGYDIAELMGRVGFGGTVYLILRGELPEPKVGDLMEAMLVSSIDHGATPPSVLAARTEAAPHTNTPTSWDGDWRKRGSKSSTAATPEPWLPQARGRGAPAGRPSA